MQENVSSTLNIQGLFGASLESLVEGGKQTGDSHTFMLPFCHRLLKISTLMNEANIETYNKDIIPTVVTCVLPPHPQTTAWF